MKTLAESALTTACDQCRGTSQLRQVIHKLTNLNLSEEIFVCDECGHEQSYLVGHD